MVNVLVEQVIDGGATLFRRDAEREQIMDFVQCHGERPTGLSFSLVRFSRKLKRNRTYLKSFGLAKPMWTGVVSDGHISYFRVVAKQRFCAPADGFGNVWRPSRACKRY